MKTLKHFINGHYVAGSSEDSFELVSPVDGETYAISPNANEAEVEQAYSAAEAAFSIWRKSTPAQRQKALLRLADEIERNVEASDAVELPVHDGGVEDCTSAGGRQHGGVKTKRHHAS